MVNFRRIVTFQNNSLDSSELNQEISPKKI